MEGRGENVIMINMQTERLDRPQSVSGGVTAHCQGCAATETFLLSPPVVVREDLTDWCSLQSPLSSTERLLSCETNNTTVTVSQGGQR